MESLCTTDPGVEVYSWLRTFSAIALCLSLASPVWADDCYDATKEAKRMVELEDAISAAHFDMYSSPRSIKELVIEAQVSRTKFETLAKKCLGQDA